MKTVHRKLRLPNEILDILRDLRDSYATPRPLSSLVASALRQPVVGGGKYVPTTRGSEKIDVWLPVEFGCLEHAEIVDRVCRAAADAANGVRPDVVKMNATEGATYHIGK